VAAREHADVTMLAGYLLRADGSAMTSRRATTVVVATMVVEVTETVAVTVGVV
jgi:hypothetical protein